jgi:hypothetical protein
MMRWNAPMALSEPLHGYIALAPWLGSVLRWATVNRGHDWSYKLVANKAAQLYAAAGRRRY